MRRRAAAATVSMPLLLPHGHAAATLSQADDLQRRLELFVVTHAIGSKEIRPLRPGAGRSSRRRKYVFTSMGDIEVSRHGQEVAKTFAVGVAAAMLPKRQLPRHEDAQQRLVPAVAKR